MNEQHSKKYNNLHTREMCPNCHFVFVSGYDPDDIRQCPSCHQKFISKSMPNNCHSNTTNRGANNVYYRDQCPALMSDGRFLTDYNSTNELTNAMRKKNGFQSSNQFRIFMQTNGDLFMNAERKHLLNKNTCQTNIACSEGWYDLWTKRRGSWAN